VAARAVAGVAPGRGAGGGDWSRACWRAARGCRWPAVPWRPAWWPLSSSWCAGPAAEKNPAPSPLWGGGDHADRPPHPGSSRQSAETMRDLTPTRHRLKPSDRANKTQPESGIGTPTRPPLAQQHKKKWGPPVPVLPGARPSQPRSGAETHPPPTRSQTRPLGSPNAPPTLSQPHLKTGDGTPPHTPTKQKRELPPFRENPEAPLSTPPRSRKPTPTGPTKREETPPPRPPGRGNPTETSKKNQPANTTTTKKRRPRPTTHRTRPPPTKNKKRTRPPRGFSPSKKGDRPFSTCVFRR